MRELIVIILLFSGTYLNAQILNQKNVFGFSWGISAPRADFAKKTFEYDAGFAKSGPDLQIDYYRLIGMHFAFNATLGYSNFIFDESAYKSEYNELLFQEKGIVVSAGNYQVFYKLIGFVFRFPAIPRSEIFMRAQIGYSYSIHPEITVVDNNFGLMNSVEKSKSLSICAGTGIGLRYNLSEKYALNFIYSLNRTKPSFEDKNDFGRNFKLPIRYQNFNLGFSVYL
jgi:hypothetical protein